jgi:hypothetical protein
VIALAFILAAAIAVAVRFTEPGGLYRVPVIVRGLRYHRAGLARHACREQAPAPTSVLETVPDPVSPFAARTA